jgi:hypothetical protein
LSKVIENSAVLCKNLVNQLMSRAGFVCYGKVAGATKSHPTPFAADSGFAASGYAPRASNRFGK